MSACNCIDLTDAALSEHNTELGVVHIMSEPAWSRRIAITTSVIEKRRGAKPVRIVAQFCPLCGVAYEQRTAATAAPAVQAGGTVAEALFHIENGGV